MKRVPRADIFKIRKTSRALTELAQKKDFGSLAEAADFAMMTPDQESFEDVFSNGVRIGLLMAMGGERTAVQFTIQDSVIIFIGNPKDVMRRVKGLKNNEEKPS